MDPWFSAANAFGLDPFLIFRIWTPRQLTKALAWLDRQWNVPSRSDWYLMRLAQLQKADGSPEQPLEFKLSKPVRRGKKGPPRRTAEEQAAEDRRISALWRGVISMQTAVKKEKPGG